MSGGQPPVGCLSSGNWATLEGICHAADAELSMACAVPVRPDPREPISGDRFFTEIVIRPRASIRSERAEPEPYVEAWEDELPEHPIIDELRAQPGRWAVVSMDTYAATRGHPRLERRPPARTGKPPALRWLPDPVVAAMQVLKSGGYGG